MAVRAARWYTEAVEEDAVSNDARLELSPEAMRALGYAVVDAIVARHAGQHALEVTTRRTRANRVLPPRANDKR